MLGQRRQARAIFRTIYLDRCVEGGGQDDPADLRQGRRTHQDAHPQFHSQLEFAGGHRDADFGERLRIRIHTELCF